MGSGPSITSPRVAAADEDTTVVAPILTVSMTLKFPAALTVKHVAPA